MKNIIVAENEEEIVDAIVNYDERIKNASGDISSNNKKFNEMLEEEIKKIL